VFDQMDATLKDWVAQALGSIEITLDAPVDSRPGKGVSLHLIEMAFSFPSSGYPTPELRLDLRYLVSTWAETQEEAHRLLGQLVFAALSNATFNDLHPVSPETWQAFNARPRPGFILQAPVTLAKPEEVTKIVTQPLIVQSSPLIPFSGRVLGPKVGEKEMPLPNARVEIPFLNLSTLTDLQGWFNFTVPADPEKYKNLRVVLKGWSLDVTVDAASRAHEPLVIHFDPFNLTRE
jgi:hypothetical protein